MFNPLTIFKKKDSGRELKERVFKNREGVLDVMGDNIKGARQCPFLMGQKCIGQFCEFFMEFQTINDETGSKIPYWRCSFVQTPLLLIELNNNIRSFKKEV